jgi:hypothetical protein
MFLFGKVSQEDLEWQFIRTLSFGILGNHGGDLSRDATVAISEVL